MKELLQGDILLCKTDLHIDLTDMKDKENFMEWVA